MFPELLPTSMYIKHYIIVEQKQRYEQGGKNIYIAYYETPERRLNKIQIIVDRKKKY